MNQNKLIVDLKADLAACKKHLAAYHKVDRLEADLTQTEKEYAAYLTESRSVSDITTRFGASMCTAGHTLMALRAKGVADSSISGRKKYWHLVEDADTIERIPLTPLQREHLELIQESCTTAHIEKKLHRSYSAVMGVVRRLQLYGYIDTRRFPPPARYKFMWSITDAGQEALDREEEV